MPDPMPTPEQIEAWTRVCEAATPGPWILDAACARGHVYCDDALGSAVANAWMTHALRLSANEMDANAEFIATSRAALPLLLAEVRRLREQLGEKEGDLGTPCGRGKSDGISRIAAERQRQVEKEGWTPEHDDEHVDESLARVATFYATPPDEREMDGRGRPRGWPLAWHAGWWKPSPRDRVRELAKAGALLAAEIDRLQRAASPRTTTAAGGPQSPSHSVPRTSEAL